MDRSVLSVQDVPGNILQDIQHQHLNETSYLGIPTQKNAFDIWQYQQIIYETRPGVIVEVGNADGGVLLWLVHLCQAMDHGCVVGVDKNRSQLDQRVSDHPLIKLIDGDANEVYPSVAEYVSGWSALVIEDSSHEYEHTLQVLRNYSQLIQPGGYMIVEDGIVQYLGVDSQGPLRAIQEFVQENPQFEIDRSRESVVTWNPCGYLRRSI